MDKLQFFSENKIAERVFESVHPMIPKRIAAVKKLNYKLYVHDNTTLDRLKPVFTIILTIYNANISFIKESLKAVFEQTYANTEVILINNGSNAEIEELIWGYFLKNKNARLIETTKNEYDPYKDDVNDPIINLWNAGLFCSVGDYIYFLSYDDTISVDYTERMVALFRENALCTTASPLVRSINEFGEINEIITESLRKGNNRDRYTNGVELAQSYMRQENKILFPGGLLASRSKLVLQMGGFDNMNDWSQLFKFGIHGESGFDPRAGLYWRHHSKQANRHQKSLGLVYVRNCREFLVNYDIESLHRSVCGEDFVREFKKWYAKFSAELSISSVRDALSYGILPYIKATYRLMQEKAPLNFYGNVFVHLPIDLFKYVSRTYTPRFLKKIYRYFKPAT